MNRLFLAAGCAGVIAFASVTADALPRFAAETGKRCQACHVNPSGGGMRKLFGAQYGREELPVPGWSEGTDLSDVTNILNNLLGVGADFQTLYFVRQVPDITGTSTTHNAFWQMQGDLYLDFRVSKKVQLYLMKGLYSGFEAFGLLDILPANGNVKVGKFIPNFGLKLDDHTAFVRTYTGFSPEAGRPELTGLEAGISPGFATISTGLFNASDGFGAGTGDQKAWLVRAEGVWQLGENADLWIGANVFGTKLFSNSTRTLYGGFGSLHLGPVTVLGEADWIHLKTGTLTISEFVLYGEANFNVTRGVDLIAGYDFLDPNLDFETGTSSRISLGVAFYPLSGVEIRPVYRIMSEKPTSYSNNEFHFLFHLYI